MFVAVVIAITKSEQLFYWRDKLENRRRRNCVFGNNKRRHDRIILLKLRKRTKRSIR